MPLFDFTNVIVMYGVIMRFVLPWWFHINQCVVWYSCYCTRWFDQVWRGIGEIRGRCYLCDQEVCVMCALLQISNRREI